MSPRFDLSLPDSRMAAALILSRRLRARVAAEFGPGIDWTAVRLAGTLPPDLHLPCIELFRYGAYGDVDTAYEAGRVLVAPAGALGRARAVLARIPGRGAIQEIRLDGDWVICRLRTTRRSPGAGRDFFQRHARRFPAELSIDGSAYRCSYGFDEAVPVIGVDLLAVAVEDVQSWFDSFGQVLWPLYQPGEEDLQEVLVISPLGLLDSDDPWCWSRLADRLLPFLLADFSPAAAAHPQLVAHVDRLLGRFRARPWSLPVSPRRFRRVQKRLHWTFEGEFDEVPTLLEVVSACEDLMQQFAREFEPLIAAHAEALLETMETYCAAARVRLWERLQGDDER